MREVAELLNALLEAGVIRTYALFGATAQMRYTEPVATLDADVLVELPGPARLDVLGPIYEYCARLGLRPQGEAIRVGAWPVQFIPPFDPLTREAMNEAEVAVFDGVPLRVVSAVHLALIALSVGRPKDHARVLALLESNRFSRDDLGKLAERHGLAGKWVLFCRRFLDE